jgi:hypothetical protein
MQAGLGDGDDAEHAAPASAELSAMATVASETPQVTTRGDGPGERPLAPRRNASMISPRSSAGPKTGLPKSRLTHGADAPSSIDSSTGMMPARACWRTARGPAPLPPGSVPAAMSAA